VVAGPILLPAEVAQVVVRDAREAAVSIRSQNAWGEKNCDGWE
jgi:hypothetical protein